MSSVDQDIHYDFGGLVEASLPTLLRSLADAHSALANLHVRIAFLRQEEDRGNKDAKETRHQMEGLRDAYTEKKWLIKMLIEHGATESE